MKVKFLLFLFSGQAYYNRNAPPLELNEQNPLCRFKAVGYSKLGGKEDKDGHVAMMFNKYEQEIKYAFSGAICIKHFNSMKLTQIC